MKWLLIIYLLFQIMFDHWSGDDMPSKVIYFAFQYGWVGAVALYCLYKKMQPKGLYLIAAGIFLFLSVNELLALNLDEETYELMVCADPPVYVLTISAIILFITYEIITKWKRKSV